MNGVRVCGIGLWFALAMAACSTASAAPDISGTYWATSYNPNIQVVGGGDPPLNAAGKAAYEMNLAALKDGSLVDKARRVCVPDGVPRVLATPYPFEIFQVPAGQVTFLYEMNHQVRVIVMDRPCPGSKASPPTSGTTAIRSAIGTATRWWWNRPGSTTGPSSMPAACLTART
jgi:hypothetical protein